MATVSLASSTLERFVNCLHDAFAQGDDEVANKTVETDNVRRLQEQYRPSPAEKVCRGRSLCDTAAFLDAARPG
jgi:hypothetical protein